MEEAPEAHPKYAEHTKDFCVDEKPTIFRNERDVKSETPTKRNQRNEMM